MSNALTSNTNLASYDYIIAGAGGAGLSLLHYLMESPGLSSKSILVIDKSFQKTNDRTWCFWNKDASAFENLVKNSWDTISIHAEGFDKELPTAPFSYKMIQGIDFYNSILKEAKTKSKNDAVNIGKFEIRKGPYGFYFQHNKKNYGIGNRDPSTLTEQDCKQIISSKKEWLDNNTKKPSNNPKKVENK